MHPFSAFVLAVAAVAALTTCGSESLRTDVAKEPNLDNKGSTVAQGPRPQANDPSGLPFVLVDLARSLGNSKASVAIVEFADYQCPYCRRFHVSTLPKLHEAYIETGRVRYFYLDFPLTSHEQAFPAAVAARCAGEQGRYWQMQELLYAEQARLGKELYPELAAELNLDADRFQACQRSGVPSRAVRRDVAEGRRVGVSGTPTFIIGRVQQDRVLIKRTAVGAPSFETFARELDALAP